MTRVLTALLLVPLATGLIFYAPPLAVRAALAAVALLCLRECLDIVQKMGADPFRPTAFAAGAVLILTSVPMGGFLIGVLALLMMLTLHRVRHEAALAAVACTLFALSYTSGPFALARRLHDMSPHWLFVVLLVNWVGDSAAMYVGKAIGRHKLAPSISPGKTWEGTIASVILGAAAGTAYLMHFQPGAGHPVFLAGFSLATNVAGQLGDLAESVLKRGAHIKDSGELLPGHGGMLDRMDGALFAIPAAYLYLIASTWIAR
jgi:phosphatidate cytidylyltransferase